MFREVCHAEKNKRHSKNMHRFFNRFFIVFPSKIHATSSKKHEDQLCAQKSTEIHVWKVIFQQKIDFARFLESLWVPGGLPGPPGSLPESIIFLINLQLRLKTGPDGPQGGPSGPPGHPQGTILGRILDRFYISKNIEQNIKY